ncbi:hypothetical protein CXB51_014803 [Gossypium anomalum]|uniref:Retrovirus-related Pol polyprotein from transposon TNT 1-94-like beta-barrel domain-containing protein n=1 Tax=Gossypium anomalum TaxID=47600 RepID=A0A8J5Z612_9ROSI|nr:hypothetical protein CXB51_014803 [Gossypium anomalum]
MEISESFQVAAIIEKLPLTWNDFKNYLKHKRKEMMVEDVIVRLRIEEDNRGAAKRLKKETNPNFAKANIVEVKKDSKKRKHSQTRLLKRVRKNEANAVESISKKVSDLDHCAVISEVNLVDSNPREWWLDTGATRHICCNNDSFVELVPCEKGEKLYIGNNATSKIKGKGTVILKLTSGKELKLQNVLYVSNICKNLVFETFLSMHGFRMLLRAFVNLYEFQLTLLGFQFSSDELQLAFGLPFSTCVLQLAFGLPFSTYVLQLDFGLQITMYSNP